MGLDIPAIPLRTGFKISCSLGPGIQMHWIWDLVTPRLAILLSVSESSCSYFEPAEIRQPVDVGLVHSNGQPSHFTQWQRGLQVFYAAIGYLSAGDS